MPISTESFIVLKSWLKSSVETKELAKLEFQMLHSGSLSLRSRNGPGRVHEADVTECLREVTQPFAGRRHYLHGKQPDIIRIRNRPLNGRAGQRDHPGQRRRLGQPGGTEEASHYLPG